ncbi:MAG: prepilin peptidase [Pirellulales bacterium]|nr:prepilin peptidase [Pirellulales bacterium]
MLEHASLIAATVGAGFEPQLWWMPGVWITVLGMFLGSFMNVVVYRMPRARALAFPGSQCPVCSHHVRWFDNVPVFSWLLLRARCRDCHTPISGRYPLVEAIVGAMFLWLALAEVYSGGVTLPAVREVYGLAMHVVAGARRTTAYDGALWLTLAYHLFMMCTLVCAALIEYDRKCPPLKLYWPALVVGLAFPIGNALVRPIPAWPIEALAGAAWTGGLTDGLIGLAAGLAAGLLLAIGGRDLDSRLAAPLNMMIVGVFLGWQAALFVAAATSAVALMLGPVARRLPDSVVLTAVTFAFLLNWGRLAERLPSLLGPNVTVTAVGCAVAILVVVGTLRLVFHRSR